MHIQTLSSHQVFIATLIMITLRPTRLIAMAFNGSTVHLSRNQCLRSSMICFSSKPMQDYNTLKVVELRELLRERGLAVTGIKAELVERLTLGNEGNNSSNVNVQVPSNLQFLEQTGDNEEWDEECIDDSDDDEEYDPNKTVMALPRREKESIGGRGESARASTASGDDFRATRVFVQGLPKEATWQDLKDHFQLAGEVTYASVSVDRKTGESKQCGIVQYETPEMATKAIREMRNHPMSGATLYVRKDVQESRSGRNEDRPVSKSRYEDDYNINLPSEWRRANDEDDKGGQYELDPNELKQIEKLVQQRDLERRKKRYKLSDQIREELKEQHGVHMDDNLKLWWTYTSNGQVPGLISDIKGDGRWGKQQPWRQIPTTPENDEQVDSDVVFRLLNKRDKARKMKDFNTADILLQQAYEAPLGGLGLRIHDESRTWRVWTEAPPPKRTPDGEKLTPEEMCLKIVQENEPEMMPEVKNLLKKFPGREWGILKRLRERYES